MLSKLRHQGVAIRSVNSCDNSLLSDQLEAEFGSSLTNLRQHIGGTLGIAFIGEVSGQTRYFKTYSVPSGRLTLEREEILLKATSGARSDVTSFSVNTAQESRVWLNMKALRPSGLLTPTEILELVAEQEFAIRRQPAACAAVPDSDSVNFLISEANIALSLLSELHLLSPDAQQKAQSCLKQLQSASMNWPRQLCHGDFGPANILADESGLIAIDWEDAVWAVQGYDYLYWLTFFTNRKWLKSNVLGQTQLGCSNEVALMIMILLLKSALSVRNSTYLDNKISINQRLLEVLEFYD